MNGGLSQSGTAREDCGLAAWRWRVFTMPFPCRIVTHWLAATFRKVSALPPTHCTVTSALVSAAKGSTSAAASVRPRPPAGDNRSISAVHLMASRHAGPCERFDPVRYAESKTPSADYGVFR